MKFLVSIISIILLFSTQAQAFREVHGSTARMIVQSALIYANDHDERLPVRLEDVPNLDSIIDNRIPRGDIYYLLPHGATTALPSDTPTVWVVMRGQNMVAVGFLGGNVQYFERRPSHRPKGLLEGKNLILAMSGGLNLLLVFLLVISSLARRKGAPNKSAQVIP